MRKRTALFTTALLALASAALAQTPERGGTLQLAVDQSPVGLDPHVATAFSTVAVNSNIYEGLVEIDPALKVRPALATRWTRSPDGLSYTFTLRPGVSFHNGQALTAEDVVFSMDRVKDAKTASPYASRLSLVKDIRATGPLEVRFELSRTFTPFLSELAGIAIVPAAYVRGGGDLQRRAVGTGPFQLKEWAPDTFVLLERNPRYWQRGLPYLDALRFNIVPDASTRQLGLQGGTYQMLPNVDASIAATLKSAPGVQLLRSQDLGYSLLGMNVSRKPFDNPLVREALNLAIDRNQLVQAVYFGEAQPAGPLSPLLRGFAPPAASFPCYSRNVERARQLLRQAGYPNGVDFNILTFSTIKTVADTAQVLQAQLRDAGFRAKLDVQEFGSFVQNWRNSNFDAFVSLNGGSADPDGYLYRTFVTGGSTNVFKYSDPTVDRLLEQGRTTDGATRVRAYSQLQSTLACRGPVAHLAYGVLFSAARTNVKGFVPHPSRSLASLRATWIDR